MTQAARLNDAIENIYASLSDNNRDLDARINELKASLAESGQKEVTFQPDRLFQNDRQGRKLMQSYFKKRGVTVTFASQE